MSVRATAKLREFRFLANLSQAEVADRAGTTQSTISRIEAGQLLVGKSLAHRICKALRISLAKALDRGLLEFAGGPPKGEGIVRTRARL